MKQITMHIGITVLHPVPQAVVFTFVFITMLIANHIVSDKLQGCVFFSSHVF